jgi:hypothetical protein
MTSKKHPGPGQQAERNCLDRVRLTALGTDVGVIGIAVVALPDHDIIPYANREQNPRIRS